MRAGRPICASFVLLLGAIGACAHPAQKPSTPTSAAAKAPSVKVMKPARGAIIFRAKGFPTFDAAPVDDAELHAALDGLDTLEAYTTDVLDAAMAANPHDVLVMSYGSAFPVDSWPRIRAFLANGGGLVVLGGAPFHQPVVFDRGQWIPGPRTPAFAHDLLIGPAEAVKRPDGSTSFALTIRLATAKEYPLEHGSAGPATAVPRALVPGELLELDRANGARWVLHTTDRKPEIRKYLDIALQGAVDTRAIPKRASVNPGERPEIQIATAGPARVTVLDSTGHSVFETRIQNSGVVAVDAQRAPGLYRVDVDRDDGPEPRRTQTGFWVKDAHLLTTGPKLGVSRDWLTKDGKPFPVVGTTYMASDVHRHFLFEPNPAAWDADFAEMEKRGINFVRTGLWTAWSRVMPDRTVDEGVLAALEAFVQTAASHGIVVCFNLFAFLPPNYDGDNPYLDPRSLAGQRTLVGAFARRFAGVSWIHWDLINEPSYAPLKKLWSTKPIGDASELVAWKSWVDKRHGAPSRGALAALWADAGDPLAVPVDNDFERDPVMVGRHPRKARDFREMTEEAVTTWASTLRAHIRAEGGDPLVTLGQDEGGIYERATQQFLGSALDYTAVHTWWKNDDLLWDGVLTKVIGKPSLHQETGLMRLERPDGTPWRTPEAAAKLLERKLGYAFAGRGAGVVEWVWNINPLMPLDEETTIGLWRPDGTAKPELDVLEKYARFFKAAAPYLEDFEADPVMVIVPHARAFLGMPGAIDATKPVVRILAERFGVVPAAMSDLKMDADHLRGVKLVVVPDPSVLDEPAAKLLLEASKAGTKVLFTGAIVGNSYGQETLSLSALGLLGPNRPVAMNERTPWSKSGSVGFDNLLQETALRADASLERKISKATNVWHEPLPLELSNDRDALARMLGAALDAAGVKPAFVTSEAGLAGRVLLAQRHALVVLVNERSEAALQKVMVDGHSVQMRVESRGTSLAIVERATGKILVASDAAYLKQ